MLQTLNDLEALSLHRSKLNAAITFINTIAGNVYKVTYYEVIAGASGNLTTPANSTINADEFGLSGNCVLSEIDGFGKPTFVSPQDSGGNVVTASLNTVTGAWVKSGTTVSANVALIYSLNITEEFYSNLNNFYIIGDPTPIDSWSSVLGVRPNTNGNNPIIDDGDQLFIGSNALRYITNNNGISFVNGSEFVTIRDAGGISFNGNVVSMNEIGYVAGVTGPIQTQLAAKENLTNKAVNFGTVNNTLYPTVQAVVNYVTGLGYITGITGAMVTAALGYTPYNATNPAGYISGITSGMVTGALGYTPYNATNPNSYISGITSSMINTALGYTAGTILGSISATAGLVPFGTGTSNTVSSDSAFVWDNTNKRLQVGTATVTNYLSLNISSSANAFSGLSITNTNNAAFGSAIYFNNDTNLGGILYFPGTIKTGNWTGTSVPYANKFFMQSGANGAYDYVNAATNIWNLIGTTTSSYATKLDAVGFRIDTMANIHTANSAAFAVGSVATIGSNGTFTCNGTNVGFYANNVGIDTKFLWARTGGALYSLEHGGAAGWYIYNNGTAVIQYSVTAAGNFGIGNFTGALSSLTVGGAAYFGGNVAAQAGVHVVRTTEQLRVGYDANNYIKWTIDNTGGALIGGLGTGAGVVQLSVSNTGGTYFRATNTSTGTAAYSAHFLSNSANNAIFYKYSTGFTTSGIRVANALYVDNTGDVVLNASTGNAVRFGINNTEVIKVLNTGITIGGGIGVDGSGTKHSRVTTGSIAGGSTGLVTITWTTAFADANYTVQASVLDSTATSLSLSVVHIESITAGAVTVRVLNNSVGNLTGTVHVVAIHD